VSQVTRIRNFLIRSPKPALVRVSGDGEPQDLKPGKSYAKCAETIDALDVDLIECLDGAGQLLRALRIDGAEADESKPPGSVAPEIPAGLSVDPNAMMLTHFANLIHRAYQHSSEIAFGKMVELVERMNDRSQSIEERLERSEATNRRIVNEQVEDAFARAEEVAEKAGETGQGGELVQQLAGAFLSGSLQKKAERSPPPNGKGQS
jgi:hypothetical protein